MSAREISEPQSLLLLVPASVLLMYHTSYDFFLELIFGIIDPEVSFFTLILSFSDLISLR